MTPRLAIGIATVLALLAAIWAIYHRGESAGGARVTHQFEQQHADRVVEARTDERAATAAAAATGTQALARADAAVAALRLEEQRIHDAFDAVPPAAPGAAYPAAPAGVLAASANAIIARANRAADDADPAGRAGPDRAP